MVLEVINKSHFTMCGHLQWRSPDLTKNWMLAFLAMCLYQFPIKTLSDPDRERQLLFLDIDLVLGHFALCEDDANELLQVLPFEFSVCTNKLVGFLKKRICLFFYEFGEVQASLIHRSQIQHLVNHCHGVIAGSADKLGLA